MLMLSCWRGEGRACPRPPRTSMARTDNLPRMQNQPPARRVEAAPPIAPEVGEPVKKRKPDMMRQDDLIDRVKADHPNTHEHPLKRAHGYAMMAHGTQVRGA